MLSSVPKEDTFEEKKTMSHVVNKRIINPRISEIWSSWKGVKRKCSGRERVRKEKSSETRGGRVAE